MRILPALAVALTLLVAGCLASDGPPLTPGPEQEDGPAGVPAGHPTFCETKELCDFWDDTYHEYVVYDLDTTELDVVVIPPAGPFPTEDTDAARLAVQAWSDGIHALGEPWFTEAFTMNIAVVGTDVPSADVIQDPEIIVVSTASTPGLAGIGLEPKQTACTLFGDGAERLYPVHAHDGMEIHAADCTGYGFTCIAINLGAVADQRSLYDLIAHEVGHCLGAGHVGDALDFSARYAPVEDIMSYQSNETQVHCVSNLNVRVLEGVYAHLLDRPADERLPSGSFYEMAIPDYHQVTCANPA